MQGKLDATITLCKTCRQGGYHMVVNLFYARLEMFMALISQYLFSKDKIQLDRWQHFPHDAAHGPSTQQSQALEIQNQYSSEFIKFNLNSLEDYDVLRVRVGRG